MADGGFRIERPIVLVGLMGAGKSTVGRRLAQKLQVPFADSDKKIEQAAGLDVAGIFQRHGERHFRELERQVIAGLVEEPPQVIATGGGAFLDEGTRALVLDSCVAVWIDAPIETLVDRVSGRDHRPLLEAEQPALVLARLAEQRNPIYAQAHLTVRSDAADPEAVAEAIVEALERRATPR